MCQPSIIAVSWHLRGGKTIQEQKTLLLPFSSDFCHPPEYLCGRFRLCRLHVGQTFLSIQWAQLNYAAATGMQYIAYVSLRTRYSLEVLMLTSFAKFSNSTNFM